jgi:hypothetical protein
MRSERQELARALCEAHRHAEAAALFEELLSDGAAPEEDYDAWVAGLADCSRGIGRTFEAGVCALFLGRTDEARAALAGSAFGEGGVEEVAARALTGDRARRAFRRVAALHRAQHRYAHAARAAEEAGDWLEASRDWERLRRDPRLDGRAYERALIEFNLGRMATRTGDAAVAARHLVAAQRGLEEVADLFERRGERHRAFDCYCVLVAIGRESGAYENLAEGYVNCIRVLQADALKFYALQYYEDFLASSLEAEEFHAAALLCREAADYARRLGLPYDRGYLKRAAETWWLAAEKSTRDGAPPQLAENAYLASIDAWNALGDRYHVRLTYERLVRLPLGDKRHARYEAALARFAQVWPKAVPAPPLPEYLRQRHVYPAVWLLDLVEWELGGELGATLCGLVGDRRLPLLSRRRALVALLALAEAERSGQGGALATALVRAGTVGAYPLLGPLEQRLLSPLVEVRRAVLVGCRTLFFKRTFELVERGLVDPDSSVRTAAVETVRHLHFPHAFEPLARLIRLGLNAEVRSAALESMGRLGSVEAAEVLLEVLRNEPDPLGGLARRLLGDFEGRVLRPLLGRWVEGGLDPTEPLAELARSFGLVPERRSSPTG